MPVLYILGGANGVGKTTFYDTIVKTGFLSKSLLPEINIAHVKSRVEEGGHDVAVPIMEHRYRISMMHLKSKLNLFSEVYLIDNSSEKPREIAVVKNGKLISKMTNEYKWINEILYIAEKLANKKEE